MTSYAKKAALKVLDKHLVEYQPADPLYETYTNHKGRERRRKVRAV